MSSAPTPESYIAKAQQLRAAHQYQAALQLLNDARLALGETAPLLALMADVFFDLQQHDAARQLFDRALTLDPDNIAIINNYASLLLAAGLPEKAAALLDQGIAKHPDAWMLWITKAHALLADAPAGSKAIYQRVLQNDPNLAEAHFGLGMSYVYLGDFAASLAPLRKAIAIKPQPEWQLQLSYQLLRLQQYEEGFALFRARFPDPSRNWLGAVAAPYPHLSLYEGQKLAADQKILITSEQGLGEEILFAGLYAPFAIGRQLVIECAPRLMTLFQQSMPDIEFIARGEGERLKNIQYQLSAPEILRYLPHHINNDAYLSVNKEKSAVIKSALRARHPGKKIIGLSFASKPLAIQGDPKSLRLAELRQIMALPNSVFLDLQHGDHSADLAFAKENRLPLFQNPAINPSGDIAGFAAAIAACDLVISVSNTTAHIAGAIGVPTFCLLPLGNGLMWHWFAGRRDSPFYQSMRLLRQEKYADWGSVLADLETELSLMDF